MGFAFINAVSRGISAPQNFLNIILLLFSMQIVINNCSRF